MTRYRLFMAVGGALLLIGFFVRILADEGGNSATRLIAACAMVAFAVFAPRIAWVVRHHHPAALLCLLPLTFHMTMMTFTSNLSHDMAISNLVILMMICAAVDKRVWLNLLVAIWCTCLISTAWAVETPIMSPLTYTILMIAAAVLIGMVVINFHEAQELLRRKINELNESQAFARVGTWEVDLATMTPTWSTVSHQILDVPEGTVDPSFSAMLVTSDANSDFSNQIHRFFEGADKYDSTGQIVTGNGEPMWIHSRGTTFYEQGKPVRKFGVFSDITRHVEREQALEEAKLVAESAAEARTQFLANMSHEIRTPMNGVIGMTSLLERELLSDDAKYYVEVIQGCSESLLTTINDILDFTKLDAGKVLLESRVFNVAKLLDDSLAIVRKSIDDKGLTIHLTGDAHELNLVGDPLRLSQVLVNLLSNAIKFTQTGSITIHAEQRGCIRNEQKLLLQVIDTGIGMDAQAQECLFSPFTQADASTTRKFGGTGLGLAISQKLVNQMHGELRVKSECNKGTTFSMELSLRVAEKATLAAEPEKKAPTFEGLHILLAEDNKVNQAVATRMLDVLGIQTTVVENGEEAVDQVKNRTFDVVLMDLQMPQMDGLNATRHIRALQNIQQPKIIALTANAMLEDRDRCTKAGMNDFLSKPIRLNDLRTAIAANV